MSDRASRSLPLAAILCAVGATLASPTELPQLSKSPDKDVIAAMTKEEKAGIVSGTATLADNATSRDLASLLPLTLTLSDSSRSRDERELHTAALCTAERRAKESRHSRRSSTVAQTI